MCYTVIRHWLALCCADGAIISLNKGEGSNSVKRRRIQYDPKNDYYDLIGVAVTATAAEIQQAYRQRAKTLHPDLNPERREWATEQFQRLNEAYDVLSNPELRQSYNEERWPYAPQPGTSRPKPNSDSNSQRGGGNWSTQQDWWNVPHPRQGERSSARPAQPSTPPPIPTEPPGAWLEDTPYAFLRTPYITLMSLLNSPYRWLLALLTLIMIIQFVVIVVTLTVQDDPSLEQAPQAPVTLAPAVESLPTLQLVFQRPSRTPAPLNSPTLMSNTAVSEDSPSGVATLDGQNLSDADD